MRVSEIRKVTDRKKRILLEDGTSFLLYNGEVRKLGIREEGDLSSDLLEEIRGKILKKRAILRCMNLLKASDRTVRQLHDRLKMDGYDEDLIGAALAYVAAYHYTDDRRYAEAYIRSMSGRKSRRAIRLDLEKRGVAIGLIDQAYASVLEERGQQGEDRDPGDLAAIRRFLDKKGYDPEETSWEEAQKLTASLCRRGFDLGDIRRAMSRQS